MQIGTKVSVKTKHYGIKTGTVIEARSAMVWIIKPDDVIDHASFGWIIKPDDHPRNIAARIEDIKIIS